MNHRCKVWLTPDLLEENESFNLFRCFAASHPIGAITFLATRFTHLTSLEVLCERCAEAFREALQTSLAFEDFSLYVFASVMIWLPDTPRSRLLMSRTVPRPALQYLRLGEDAIEVAFVEPEDRRFAAIAPVADDQIATVADRCREDDLNFLFLAPKTLSMTASAFQTSSTWAFPSSETRGVRHMPTGLG